MIKCQHRDDPQEAQIDSLSSVSIVIPAYNECQGILATLEALCAEDALTESQLILVDDGSTDETADLVGRFERVRLVRHTMNKGYGAALTTGMHAATRDFVVWMDSDGQHRVHDLLAVARCLVEQDLDYCIGVRDATSYQDPRRVAGKWVLRQVVRLAAGRAVPDFNSGLRGFRRSVIRKYLHLLPKGFGASTTTTLIMLERNYLGGAVSICVRPRIGKSSVKQVRDGLRTLALILRIFLLFKPLHFFGAIGLVMTVAGLGYGVWTAVSEGLGFPVLGAVVLLSGLQTIFMGLIMDQIAAMRRERFE